jgi:hypothetical protein
MTMLSFIRLLLFGRPPPPALSDISMSSLLAGSLLASEAQRQQIENETLLAPPTRPPCGLRRVLVSLPD